MLTKIIDLGCEVPETGEPRVKLIHNNLVKTASTEIQQYWDSIEQDENSSYLWVIGVSAMEYYGCNNNGDAFAENELKDTHSRFVETAHVFLQHVNKDPKKSIGKPVYSWYNDAMHRVELILKIDKKNPSALATVNKIKNGEPIYVSMGCFPRGTKVTLADNSFKNIEDILPDDKVITHTGDCKDVTARMSFNYSGDLYSIQIEGQSEILKATEEHPILVKRDNKEFWCEAKNLKENDYVKTINEYVKVKKILVERVENLTVYNLSVKDDESFVANNITVHNCVVAYDVCSICGNKAKVRKDYCDHLRYNMKKILPDGRQVYALNPDPKFFDISIVAKPADPTAHTLDKMASERNQYQFNNFSTLTLAELGEISNDINTKVASLRKLSDLIKKVDAHVVDSKDKDKDTEIEPIKKIQEQGFENISYPELPYEHLTKLNLSPCGLISCLTSLNSPITLGDAAWMSGSHVFGRCPTEGEYHDMFSLLPSVINRLIGQPSLIDKITNAIFNNYHDEFSNPSTKTIVIKIMKPVAQARIQIIKRVAKPEELEKVGEAFNQDPTSIDHYGHTITEKILNDINPRTENFAQILIRDKYGQEAVTTPYHLRQSESLVKENIAKPTITAALGLGAIGAIISQPTLLHKALALIAAGVPAAMIIKILATKDNSGVKMRPGEALPGDVALGAYKIEKQASYSIPILTGMAVPGALALDYAYNRWRYGPNGNPYEKNTLDSMGEFVAEHPTMSLLGGVLAGHGAGRLGTKVSSLFRRKPKT